MSLQKKIDDAMSTFMTDLTSALSKLTWAELFEDEAPPVPMIKGPPKKRAPRKPKAVIPVPEKAPKTVPPLPSPSQNDSAVHVVYAHVLEKGDPVQIQAFKDLFPEVLPELPSIVTVQVRQDDLGRFFATVDGKTLISTRQRSLIPRIVKAGVPEANIARCVSAKAIAAANKKAAKAEVGPEPVMISLRKEIGFSTFETTTQAVDVVKTPVGMYKAEVDGKTYTFARERDLRRKLKSLNVPVPVVELTQAEVLGVYTPTKGVL